MQCLDSLAKMVEDKLHGRQVFRWVGISTILKSFFLSLIFLGMLVFIDDIYKGMHAELLNFICKNLCILS